MKKIFTLLLCANTLSYAHSQVVISQIYGGGGNTGAPYKNDFVELFNQGTSPVVISGYSIQYASANSADGTAWDVFIIPSNKTIPARSYFLIQGAAGNSTTAADLPTPDATSTINLNATAGKVAFLGSTAALSSCPSLSSIFDLVGYGAAANCYLGTRALAPSNTTSILRKGFGLMNTNDNGSDFATGTPTPRNSAIILPLQLLSFSATPKESSVAFAWKTANERNTRHFEIEQSSDGITFKSIATVLAVGNSTTEKNYTYTGSLNASPTYYHLKMVDTDGNSNTSSVVKIVPSKTGFSLGNVYPIPAKNNVTIEWNSNHSGATTLVLTDMSGRAIRTLRLQSAQGFNQYPLDVHTLVAGQYFLRLKNDMNQVQTIITKQ